LEDSHTWKVPIVKILRRLARQKEGENPQKKCLGGHKEQLISDRKQVTARWKISCRHWQILFKRKTDQTMWGKGPLSSTTYRN